MVHDEPVLVSDANEPIEQAYRRQAAKLWRALVAFSGDQEVASDAVAEAFAQALGRGDAVRDAGRWVWKVAFRIAAGELKDRSRHRGQPPEAAYDLPEPVWDLAKALSLLSDRQRAALILHHYVGYSTARLLR